MARKFERPYLVHDAPDRIPNPDLTRSEAIALIDSSYKDVAFLVMRRRSAVLKLKDAVAALDAERRQRRQERRRWNARTR